MSGGKKPSTEEVLQRIDELLNVLNMIARDLRDISKALREGTPTAAPAAPRPTPAPPSAAPARTSAIEDLRVLFPPDLEEMLEFEEVEEYIRIKPRRFLGSDNFAKIASIVRGAGGEYVSAGKDSHFRVSKERM